MRARSLLLWIPVAGLLVPALVLTFGRLVEPEAEAWVRLEAFTPLAMPLYAVGALLLTVVALRSRARRRVATAGLALVAVAGLALHAWWFAPLLTGANPPAPAGALTLRVMTANLHAGTGDGITLVREVSEQRVDLLVVQEITAPLLATMEQAGLETVLPYRAGEPGEAGQGTMVFAREPLGQATPLEMTWDAWRVSAGDLTLLAVHPVSPADTEGWRRDHATLLAAAQQGDVDLVVGDLNATVDHPPMRRLADAGFRPVTELANEGWQPTWPSYGVWEVAGLRLPRLVQIDHVLVGSGLAAVGSHTVDIPGSDHRALVAEVAVK